MVSKIKFLTVSIFILIVANVYCKEKGKLELDSGQHDPKLNQLSKSDIITVKELLKNHLTSYNYLKPEETGNMDNYSSEDSLVRVYPDKGLIVYILTRYEISDSYTIGNYLDIEYFYEFYVDFDVKGEVNLTTNTVTFYKPTRIRYKYGVIQENDKWKIYLDGSGFIPVPDSIFIRYFNKIGRGDLVREIEVN